MKLQAFAFTAVAALLAGPVTAQEMREFTDVLGRTVEIPVDPQRIVSLRDSEITTPLIELGAPVVGSHGRPAADGTPYLRPASQLFGVTFDNSDIEFVGNELDFEVVAALQPDLLIARTQEADLIEQMEVIAPVVFIDSNMSSFELYEQIADIAGEQEEFEVRSTRFQSLLDDAMKWIGENDYTYTLVQNEGGGNINIYSEYGALSYILDDLGFTIIGDGAALRETGEPRITTSPELLPAQDADFVFGNYRIDQGGDHGPRVEAAGLEEALPGYCDFLPACADGRLILVPRELATAQSFQAWEALTHIVVSNVAGRPGITVPN